MHDRTIRIFARSAVAISIAVLATACSKTADDTVGMSNPPAATSPAPGPQESQTSSATMGERIDDAKLTTEVKTALLKEPDVKSLDISVESMDGAVKLSGFVDSQAQIDRAVTVARAVEGVRDVQSQLALKSGDGTMGARLDDGITTTKVKAALLADSAVKGTAIEVETQNGIVQLSGFVDSQSQIDRAVQLAQGVQGVQKVDNGLSVKK